LIETINKKQQTIADQEGKITVQKKIMAEIKYQNLSIKPQNKGVQLKNDMLK
jgi:hypothetical protein